MYLSRVITGQCVTHVRSGIIASMGISLTARIREAGLKSSVRMAPARSYSSSVKMRMRLGCTNTAMPFRVRVRTCGGASGARRSQRFFVSRRTPTTPFPFRPPGRWPSRARARALSLKSRCCNKRTNDIFEENFDHHQFHTCLPHAGPDGKIKTRYHHFEKKGQARLSCLLVARPRSSRSTHSILALSLSLEAIFLCANFFGR